MDLVGYRKLIAFILVLLVSTILVVCGTIPADNWLTQIVVALGGLFTANLVERGIKNG